MGLNSRHPSPLCHSDCLDYGVQHRRGSRLVLAGPPPHWLRTATPLVNDVDALPGRYLTHEGDNLFGVAPNHGDILVSPAHAVGSFFHPLLQQSLHLADFHLCGSPSKIVAHDLPTQRAMPDQEQCIRSNAVGFHAGSLVSDRPGRTAVLICHDGRNTLRYQVGRCTIAGLPTRQASLAPTVRMHIDNPGGHNFARYIQHSTG